jgi:phosphatidylglycerophosphatase A
MFAKIILSWFGTGYSPKAPGTAGSVAALPFAWLMATYFGPSVLFTAAIVAFCAGWALASQSPEARQDPGWVVIDEVAGQWLTLALVPPDFLVYAVGLLMFRIFDIFKPWPIRTLERSVGGGLGVMIDDIASAVYAGSLTYIFATVMGH